MPRPYRLAYNTNMALILSVLLVGLLLMASEWWWRRHVAHSEFSRKFIHITVGSFVAFWPYFLSWDEIRLLSLAFLIVVGVSKRFHVFRAIHSVQRPTWGEICFALAVGLITFVTHSRAIYATALLQMSLADGLAAVVGTRYGTKNRYMVLGQPKSLAGSMTFLVISYVLLLAFAIFALPLPIAWALGLAVAATVIENLGVQGLDNLLVPLLVAIALGKLT